MVMPEEGTTLPSSARLEFFSDGVLAIAITLLILEIQVPDHAPGGLWHALGQLWPSYAAYAVSFLTIGIMWVNHHAIFERVLGADRGLLFWNLALLGAIAFLPFPTAVLARYIRNAHDAPAAAMFYGLAMIVIGLCFTGLLGHLYRHMELLVPTVTRDGMRTALQRTVFGPVTYAVATIVGAFAPYAALAMYGAVALFFAFARHSE
jgi:uncharacterized membrane protein